MSKAGLTEDRSDDFVPTDVLDLCDGVDLLIHDAQHTPAEFEHKRHWGHCTVDYAVHVAKEAGASAWRCSTTTPRTATTRSTSSSGGERHRGPHRRRRGARGVGGPGARTCTSAFPRTPLAGVSEEACSQSPDTDILTPDAASFRSVLGHFATGITVITAMDDGEPVGIAANSFTSVSLDPPLVLFCAAKTSSTTWPRIQRAGHFTVNVLDEHQEHISRLFAPRARTGSARSSGTRASAARSSHDVHAYLDCTIETEHDAGDHVIVVGRVHELGLTADAGPLLFYQGRYGRLLGSG